MTPATAIQGTVAGAATAWAFALPAATLVAEGPSDSLWHVLAFTVYGLASVICHQASERSFEILDAQLPVCARCTGLYVGAAVVSIAWMFRLGGVRFAVQRGLGHPVRWLDARRVLFLGGIPTAATLVWEWSTGAMPSNGIRALAGVGLGVSVTLVLLGFSDRAIASRAPRPGLG